MATTVLGGSAGRGGRKGVLIVDFDPEKEGGYPAGQVVVYDGETYRFTEAHTGAWTGTDVEEITIVEGQPVKLMVGLEFDGETTGLVKTIHSDFAEITDGEINETTGLVSVDIDV